LEPSDSCFLLQISQVQSNFVYVGHIKFWIVNFKFNMKISIELDSRPYKQKPGEPFDPSRLVDYGQRWFRWVPGGLA
jgi:hypothetical protein